MTVTVVATTANSKQTQLVVKQSQVTALATAAATTSFQQTSQSLLLKQYQEELVRGCFDCTRLNAGAVISTFSSQFTAPWLAKYAPLIATLTANGTSGANSSLLTAEQIRAVDLAMAQGLVSAASILSTMS